MKKVRKYERHLTCKAKDEVHLCERYEGDGGEVRNFRADLNWDDFSDVPDKPLKKVVITWNRMTDGTVDIGVEYYDEV